MVDPQVQTMVLSATLTKGSLSKYEYILPKNDLQLVDCNQEENSSNKNIDEFKVLIDSNEKLLLLVSMFKLNILPLKVLIFTNSVETC